VTGRTEEPDHPERDRQREDFWEGHSRLMGGSTTGREVPQLKDDGRTLNGNEALLKADTSEILSKGRDCFWGTYKRRHSERRSWISH